VRHVKKVLPDPAALPGWKRLPDPMATTDPLLCQSVFADTCSGVVALGSTDFTREGRTDKEGVRLTLNLYSFRDGRAPRSSTRQ
jgi:hypothetical protein